MIYHTQLCAQLALGTTPQGWRAIDGPESGTGVDYWYKHRGSALSAYVNEDQGATTVTIMDDATGETLASDTFYAEDDVLA